MSYTTITSATIVSKDELEIEVGGQMFQKFVSRQPETTPYYFTTAELLDICLAVAHSEEFEARFPKPMERFRKKLFTLRKKKFPPTHYTLASILKDIMKRWDYICDEKTCGIRPNSTSS